MKVLVLTPSYPCDGRTAGTFHKTQADALARLGVEVEVIAPIPWVPYGFEYLSGKWGLYKKIPGRYRSADVSVIRPRYLQLPRGDYWARTHSSYSRLAKSVASWRPEIIHAHFAYPCGLAALGLSRDWNVPCVLTLHGDDVNTYPSVNRLTRSRFVRTVRGAGRVLAVSGVLADRAEQIAGRRPEVLPVGIDLRLFGASPGREPVRTGLGIPDDKRVVLFVGDLSVRKGVRELLHAIRTLREENVIGVFVGDGPLRGEVQACPGAIRAGSQPNRDLVRYYSMADVFVLPSYIEGLPTVLVEAGAVGLPVIATGVGGIPELLGDARGLIIPSRNAGAIAACIRTVLTDKIQSTRRALALREYVFAHYDSNKIGAYLINIYNSF